MVQAGPLRAAPVDGAAGRQIHHCPATGQGSVEAVCLTPGCGQESRTNSSFLGSDFLLMGSWPPPQVFGQEGCTVKEASKSTVCWWAFPELRSL